MRIRGTEESSIEPPEKTRGLAQRRKSLSRPKSGTQRRNDSQYFFNLKSNCYTLHYVLRCHPDKSGLLRTFCSALSIEAPEKKPWPAQQLVPEVSGQVPTRRKPAPGEPELVPEVSGQVPTRRKQAPNIEDAKACFRQAGRRNDSLCVFYLYRRRVKLHA